MNFWERDQYSTNQNGKNKQSNNANSNFNASNNHDQQTQGASHFNIYEQMSRLNNMSEEERLRELTKTATNMKKDGILNGQDLEKVYQTAGMFMTSEQLSRLRSLIDMLKQ